MHVLGPHKHDKSISFFTIVVVWLVALYRIVVFVSLCIGGIANIQHYTYWNYTFGTVFYTLLALSYLDKKRYLFHVLTQFALPALFGSVMLVFTFISIILVLNGGWMFIESTDLGEGSTSVGVVYAGDKIIHDLPVVDLFLVFMSGYLVEARRSVLLLRISKHYSTNPVHFDWCYLLYCFVAPLLPMLLYACFYDPFETYPTVAQPVVLLVIGTLLWLSVMYFYFESITRKKETDLLLVDLGESTRMDTTHSNILRLGDVEE